MTTETTNTPPIVFLDTETTSLDRTTRFPWEIALIRREPDGTEAETVFQVDVYGGTSMAQWAALPLAIADPMSLNIGRFHERYANEPDVPVLRAAEAGQKVEEWTRGAVLVGAVPSFDEETLWKLVRGAQRTPTWHYHLVDVETLAAGALKLSPPYDFDKVLAAYGLTYDEADRHTALGDARMAKRLYDGVLAGSRGSVPVTLDRPDLEEDRYMVLLACGHWAHTRAPDAVEWPCPVVEPSSQNHGMQRAACTSEGRPAVLVSWDLHMDQANADG